MKIKKATSFVYPVTSDELLKMFADINHLNINDSRVCIDDSNTDNVIVQFAFWSIEISPHHSYAFDYLTRTIYCDDVKLGKILTPASFLKNPNSIILRRVSALHGTKIEVESLCNEKDELVQLFLVHNDNVSYAVVVEMLDKLNLELTYPVLTELVVRMMNYYPEATKIAKRLQAHNPQLKQILIDKFFAVDEDDDDEMVGSQKESVEEKKEKLPSY